MDGLLWCNVVWAVWFGGVVWVKWLVRCGVV